MWLRKPPLWVGALIAVLITGLAAPRSALAHMIPRTSSQMVGESHHIVVATVQGREVHWNGQHTLIVTDYTLEIEDRLKGAAPARLTITMPGGTLDGETQSTCLTVDLEPGSRYLLFLGEIGKPTLSPITGAWQGVFREIPEKDGARHVAAGMTRGILADDGTAVEFLELVEAVRTLVARVEALPAVEEKRSSGAPRQELSAKMYDPAAAPVDLQPAMPLTAQASDAFPPPFAEPGEIVDATDAAAFYDASGRARGQQKYFYRARASAPVVFNQLPTGDPYSPYDQYLMAYWNKYGRNLFRVSKKPTGTWAFGNGVFDVAGFPSDEDLISIFGRGWPENTLGVTFRRGLGGRVLESDIALNPAIDWSLDPRETTRRDNSLWNFHHTMLHELGHAWGLDHPWETQDVSWDSVLNYAPKEYRLAELFRDDTAAVRRAFPGLKLRDVLISSYMTADSPEHSHATYVAARPSVTALEPGASFFLTTPIKIENVGTAKIVNFSVEIYLTPERFSFEGAVLLKTVRFQTSLLSSHEQLLDPGTLTIPASAGSGTYYLAFFVRDRADSVQSNNSAWSNWNVTVSVQ